MGAYGIIIMQCCKCSPGDLSWEFAQSGVEIRGGLEKQSWSVKTELTLKDI